MVPRRKLARGRIARAEGLGFCPAPPAVKAGRKDPRVVEHDQVVRPQKVRKIAKLAVVLSPAGRVSDEAASKRPGPQAAPGR